MHRGPEQGLAQRKFLASGLSVSRVPILMILLLFTIVVRTTLLVSTALIYYTSFS
jgi:hypothetical protein